MPTAQVQADDVGDRIIALVDSKRRLDASREASSIAIAAVQDFVPIDNDRFMQAVLADIGHELIKLSALNQRENVCDRMKFDRGHLKSSKLSPSGP